MRDRRSTTRPQTLRPVGNVDKITQIIDSLHDHIVDGNLAHGTELPSERELAVSLGVSRFSLREALRVAQTQGLIEITRGRRPRVAQPSSDAAAQMIALTLRRSSRTLLDLAEARIVLETHIARVAATRASEADIARMQDTIDAVAENTTDPGLCVEQDIEFHACLVRATGNVVFEIMLAPLAELLRETREETFRQGVGPVLDGHIAVLQGVKDRDGDAAEKAMRAHLELAQQHLIQGVSSRT
jgi:DNA-binding FadR family transcriptional regulator